MCCLFQRRFRQFPCASTGRGTTPVIGKISGEVSRWSSFAQTAMAMIHKIQRQKTPESHSKYHNFATVRKNDTIVTC